MEFKVPTSIASSMDWIRINRNIMEFKAFIMTGKVNFNKGINRNIMEFKVVCEAFPCASASELIET